MTGNANVPSYSVDEVLANSWDRKLATDLAEEIGSCTGDKPGTLHEMRRFLALKGYRELLQRLREVREGKIAEEALTAVAHDMRRYALERPALSAAAFRTAAADAPECRKAHENLHAFMAEVLSECGLAGQAAEHALNMLRSLVRGYVLNEMMHTFIGVESYDDSFECAVRVFVAGLSALVPARQDSSLEFRSPSEQSADFSTNVRPPGGGVYCLTVEWGGILAPHRPPCSIAKT